jgi:hydrogenase maturation protease
MERVIGYDRVILIDAMYRPSTTTDTPGTIRRMTLEDLKTISPTQHSASAHDTSLITALEMGRRMDLTLPQEFIIYAITVENIIDFGDKPTPAVAAAIPQVTAAVLDELNLLEVEGSRLNVES